MGKFCDCISDSRFLTAINSDSAEENAMYYASVVLSDIKGCILDNQTILQPANMMKYSVLDCDESG